MSCFTVTDNHLSAIIGWACRANLNAGWVENPGRHAYRPGMEQEAVDILHAANVRSVNARYRLANIPAGAVFQVNAPKLLPVEVIKACDCVEYQCTEWDEFEGSDAQKLLRDIQCAAIRALPGYEAAAWDIP